MQTLRSSFDSDPWAYEALRPLYPAELIRKVLDYARLPAGERCLEIGYGTGQATLPFLEAGLQVEASELGPQLAAFCRQKLAGKPKFRLYEGDFMELTLEKEAYQLIYAASSFHWLPRTAAYPKLRRLLAPGGTLALFWAHSAPAKEHEALYRGITGTFEAFFSDGKGLMPPYAERMERKAAALRRRGFKDVEVQLFRQQRILDGEDYIRLIGTTNRVHGLTEDARQAFEAGLAKQIAAQGGKVLLEDCFDLYLGRK